MRISDWSSDVCSSDLLHLAVDVGLGALARNAQDEAAAAAEVELVDEVGQPALALQREVTGPRPLEAGNARQGFHHPLPPVQRFAHACPLPPQDRKSVV